MGHTGTKIQVEKHRGGGEIERARDGGGRGVSKKMKHD